MAQDAAANAKAAADKAAKEAADKAKAVGFWRCCHSLAWPPSHLACTTRTRVAWALIS